jgi:HemY protein
MKYLISILLLFATAVALSTILQNTAYILLVYPPYRIELSLKLFIVIFLLVFGFGYWLIHLLLATTQLPDIVQKLRQDREKNNARKRLDVTVKAFFEGRYLEAEKAATRAIKQGEKSVIYPVIAARAAHEINAFERQETYLSQAASYATNESLTRMLETARNKFGPVPEIDVSIARDVS